MAMNLMQNLSDWNELSNTENSTAYYAYPEATNLIALKVDIFCNVDPKTFIDYYFENYQDLNRGVNG
jgi:hypothetical protein